MEWTKASIETTSLGVDAVTGALMSCGINGVEIIDSVERARYFADSTRTWDYADESLLLADDNERAYVVFYVTKDNAGDSLLIQVKESLERLALCDFDLGTLKIRQEFANDETWLHEWKKHFVPIRIGRVVVVPEWVEYQAQTEDIIFKIDPGSAFGTGQHQTTQLCISALQKWVSPQDNVLDIGCGSGILSIISLLLGAGNVCAIDIDPAGAIAATKKNAELNPINLGLMKVLAGDVLSNTDIRQTIGSGYNIVVANIVADVIIPLARIVNSFTKGGLFIASGIITDRLNDVRKAFEDAGITIIEEEELEGWHCVVGRLNA